MATSTLTVPSPKVDEFCAKTMTDAINQAYQLSNESDIIIDNMNVLINDDPLFNNLNIWIIELRNNQKLVRDKVSELKVKNDEIDFTQIKRKGLTLDHLPQEISRLDHKLKTDAQKKIRHMTGMVEGLESV